MYYKAYGIIETLAPLHVGASAGEETGNLNLIFCDQFTRTGIIPGSSIRGRFRADMRNGDNKGHVNKWYGSEAGNEQTTEALVKFEYASLVWLPVFCPGQPVVWISCPRLLARYKAIVGIRAEIPPPYCAARSLRARQIDTQGQNRRKILFFNLGFLEIEHESSLQEWIPPGTNLAEGSLVVVGDNDIALLHDMALYRQSRVKLADSEKKVEGGAFFNVEAIPEGSVFVFPIAIKEKGWEPFIDTNTCEMYFGGLESVGFGRCKVTLGGEYYNGMA
ncbi:MAG: RAMP superfamily CRISPR-associated protein [Pseudanabaenaceae cyanobacterium SKYGB_i_bin29]|nr:RAMP superfamily CRISPR-associated protein [Pseudanabaenaceae cyanobacterium SKYG29]MDW8420437.1 RAMP superfamily CRISPR-associated protein [Pseudanabaenaceae cyanobacterium SKYGB_i_bin29]